METALGGDPAQIAAAAEYLRVAARGATTLADVSATQRATLLDGWQGAAGSAFSDRARILAQTCDAVAATADRSAATLDALASALSSAQGGLSALRDRAQAAGLVVQGTRIEVPPFATEYAFFSSPETPSGIYQELRELRDQILTRFELALDDAAYDLQHDGATLGLTTANLLSAAFTAYLVRLNSHIMVRQAQFFASEARRLSAQALDHMRLARDGRIRLDYGHFDDLIDRMRAADAAAPRALAASREIPHAASRIGTSLGVLTTGAGVYFDIADGEPVVQAVTSQGASLFTSVVSGATIGTAIPAPVLGTLIGGTIGIAVGLVTDKGVDRLFEGTATPPPPRGQLGHRHLEPGETRIARLLGGTSRSQPPGTYPVGAS